MSIIKYPNSLVKNVQTGSTSFGITGNTTATITDTINAIDTSKSIVLASKRCAASIIEMSYNITDSTTLTFYAYNSSGGIQTINIEWQVLEFR